MSSRDTIYFLTEYFVQVWVATDDQRILFYSAAEPERGTELGRVVMPSDIVTMIHHAGQVRDETCLIHLYCTVRWSCKVLNHRSFLDLIYNFSDLHIF